MNLSVYFDLNRGMKLLLKKWEHKKCQQEVKEFGELWEGAYKTKHTDQVIRLNNC